MSGAELGQPAATRADVVIVGAGITGLTAAVALARAGSSVVVLEARHRVGGRAHSVPARQGTVDLGASWFWPNEPATRVLSEELGLETFPQYLDGDAVFEANHPGGRRIDGNPIDVASSRFTHGARALAEGLAGHLPTDALRLNDPVSALELTTGGVRVTSRSGAMHADQVIVALPPALTVDHIAFTPELPPELRATAEATMVWMSQMVKAVAVYERPFWRERQLSGSAISYTGPFREFHDHSGPGGAPAAIFGFAPAEYFTASGPDDIEVAFTGQLNRLFGPAAATPVAVHVLDWSRERFTVPGDLPGPGTTATFGAEVFQQPVAGRIHLAATETATAFAGHLEGAVRAGTATARRVREG